MKQTVHLQLRAPYLTATQADEIRAEAFALKPSIVLVMASWPWLEVRGLKEPDAERFVAGLVARGVRFHVLAAKGRGSRARVMVSEVLEVI